MKHATDEYLEEIESKYLNDIHPAAIIDKKLSKDNESSKILELIKTMVAKGFEQI